MITCFKSESFYKETELAPFIILDVHVLRNGAKKKTSQAFFL